MTISRELQKRIGMTISGVAIAGVAVGFFNLSSFGVDPFQSFAQGLWKLTPLGYGLFYTIINFLILILVFIFDKKKIGLGTLINMFLQGYIVQGTTYLLSLAFPNPSIGLRIVFMIIGIVVMCIGSSLYFVGDLGVSTYDAIALYLSEKKIAKFFICRIATDVCCVMVSIISGAKVVGIATIITALFMGPVITFFNRIIAYPLRYGKEKSKEFIA